MADGKTYHYQVEALYANKRLADIYGTVLTVSLSAKASQTPGSVRSLTATRQTDANGNITDETVIGVEWKAPSNAAPSTRYDVEYRFRAGNSGAWSGWTRAVTEQTETTYTFNDADGGSSYQFRVRPVNLVGSEMHPGSWQTSITVASLPAGNIAWVSASRKSDDPTTMAVSWDAAVRAAGYDVEYRINNGGWRRAASKQAGQSYELSGADDSQDNYTFRVRGVADAGPGDWTESSAVAPLEPATKVPCPIWTRLES